MNVRGAHGEEYAVPVAKGVPPGRDLVPIKVAMMASRCPSLRHRVALPTFAVPPPLSIRHPHTLVSHKSGPGLPRSLVPPAARHRRPAAFLSHIAAGDTLPTRRATQLGVLTAERPTEPDLSLVESRVVLAGHVASSDVARSWTSAWRRGRCCWCEAALRDGREPGRSTLLNVKDSLPWRMPRGRLDLQS